MSIASEDNRSNPRRFLTHFAIAGERPSLFAPLMSLPRILIVNAALNGRNGNTAVLLKRAEDFLHPFAEVRQVCLCEAYEYTHIVAELTAAQGIIFGTGTHWDSWSSLLQRLLEDATPEEGGAVWFAKPAGVLVSMHSVGGKGVVSRLQGVLCTLGCLIPPMSGLAYSYVNQSALTIPTVLTADLWSMEDAEVVAWNVLTAARTDYAYRRWPVEGKCARQKWIRE